MYKIVSQLPGCGNGANEAHGSSRHTRHVNNQNLSATCYGITLTHLNGRCAIHAWRRCVRCLLLQALCATLDGIVDPQATLAIRGKGVNVTHCFRA